jgi:hypothetical protein
METRFLFLPPPARAKDAEARPLQTLREPAARVAQPRIAGSSRPSLALPVRKPIPAAWCFNRPAPAKSGRFEI